MFTPAFANDKDLTANTTSRVVRRKAELFNQLRDMPAGPTWYQVDPDAHPDAMKFRVKVYRYSKDGAGKFKIRKTPEGLFIRKVDPNEVVAKEQAED